VSEPSVPQAPNYSNFGQANNAYSGALSGLQGLAGQGYGLTQGIVNNPYGQGYQAAAGAAGNQLTALGGQAGGASGQLYGAGSSLLNTAFDPQNALYARTQQQNQDQTGAILAASGVGATPYGQAVAAQNNSNFNIDWQNNQLQRQLQGVQGAESAFGQGASQGNLGAQATLGGGALPYSTANSILGAALGALGTQQGLDQGVTGAADQYLGLANQGYGNNLAQYNAQQNQFNGILGGLGSLLGFGLSDTGLGGLSALSGLFGGNAFSGAGSAPDSGW
jgi:hypothetical protein